MMVRSLGKILNNSSACCARAVAWQRWGALLALLLGMILLVASAEAGEAYLLENQSESPVSGILASAEVERLTDDSQLTLAGPHGHFLAQFVPAWDSPRRGQYYFQLPAAIPAGEKWDLHPVPQNAAEPDGVQVVQEEETLVIRVQGKELLRYHIGLLPSPDPQQPEFGRSGFLHPVRTALGTIVTDDFPPDHMHQHGVMFAWTDTTFDGRQVDFWNSHKQAGLVEHRQLLRQFSGPLVGGFDVQLAHVDLTSGKPVDALLETWSVRAYAASDPFRFEIQSVQQTAGPQPLVIRKYHYGGMAVRGSRAWYQTAGAGFLTSAGKQRKAGNHSRPRWVEMLGPAEQSASAGITVMGSPDNFRFPQTVRIHPDKPYFCFSPQVEAAFTIEPGSAYRSRYLFIPHDGPLDQAQTEKIWNNFAYPVRLKPAS